MRNDKEQSPLDIALTGATRFYTGSKCVSVAYYLMRNCGCGGEEEKNTLLCRACYHGELDVVKKLVTQLKVNPYRKCQAIY